MDSSVGNCKHNKAIQTPFRHCSGFLLSADMWHRERRHMFGLQRQSARRQPVVQTQIFVVQDLLYGNSSEKNAVLQGKRPWRTGEKVAKIQVVLFWP